MSTHLYISTCGVPSREAPPYTLLLFSWMSRFPSPFWLMQKCLDRHRLKMNALLQERSDKLRHEQNKALDTFPRSFLLSFPQLYSERNGRIHISTQNRCDWAWIWCVPCVLCHHAELRLPCGSHVSGLAELFWRVSAALALIHLL